MLSSDDSFGWSAASENTMSSSEDDQASKVRSVQERKADKNLLRESLLQCEHTSNIVPSGENNIESHVESSPRKNKKKNKVKEDKGVSHLDENINTPERDIINKINKIEAEDSPREKIKKKKIHSEPEEQHVIEAASPRKKNNKSKRDSEVHTENVQADVVKLDDTGHTPKKKKKKSEPEEQHVIEETSPRKKNKKSERDSELQKTENVQDDMVKLEDTGHTSMKKKIKSDPKDQHVIEDASPRKKNKKSKHNSELQETENFQDDVVKLDHTGHTPKKNKKKCEAEEQVIIEESPRKKDKKSEWHSELQETENFQDDVEKLEDTGHTGKKKKKKHKLSVEQEAADIEILDESFEIPPTTKKSRKNNESRSFDDHHQDFIGILDDSIEPSSTKKEKKKNISLADATNIELTREKAREFIRTDSVHFDDSKIKEEATNVKNKESYTSSAKLKSPSHKNSTSLSASSQRKVSITSVISAGHRDSSSSAATSSGLQETENIQDNMVKIENTGHSPKKKKKSELEGQHVVEEVSRRKKSKRSSELQETGNVQNDVVKLEDTGNTPKNKKKVRKHSVEQEQADIETKKFRNNDHQHFNGILDELSQPSSAKKKKKKTVADPTGIELTREKAQEFIRKASVHFDDLKIKEEVTNIKQKECYPSSATLKSSTRINSTSSSASSQRKVSITSVVSAGRRDSSSSAATSTRKVSISSIASSKRRRSTSSSSNRSRSRSSSSSSTHSKPTRSKTPEKVESRRKSSSPDSRSNTLPKTSRKSAAPSFRVEESRKRTTLSEKIRFEGDIDGPESETDFKSFKNDSTSFTQFEKFIYKNPKLKPLRSMGSDEAIGSDDDVWVLKCPKGYDHEKLKDMDMSIDSKTKIKLDGQTFDGVLEEETHRIAIVFPSQQKNEYVIKDVRPKGTLTFRKRIPEVHINEMSIAVPRETFIPLPETKRRHPLFGHDYRKFIKTPATVLERLNETEPRKKLKLKRKHKIEAISKDEPDFITQDDVEIKKKRKRKLSDTGSGESTVKKLKRDSAIVWDSEKAIEKSLFNF